MTKLEAIDIVKTIFKKEENETEEEYTQRMYDILINRTGFPSFFNFKSPVEEQIKNQLLEYKEYLEICYLCEIFNIKHPPMYDDIITDPNQKDREIYEEKYCKLYRKFKEKINNL